MAEAMSAAELLNEPGSLMAPSERANRQEAMGGIVLVTSGFPPVAKMMILPMTMCLYSVCFYADSDDQDIRAAMIWAFAVSEG